MPERVMRFKCVFCGSIYAQEDQAEQCEAAARMSGCCGGERSRAADAIENGTIAETEEELDNEASRPCDGIDITAREFPQFVNCRMHTPEGVALPKQVPDMREVTDKDVDAAVEANGEEGHPLECVIDVLDYMLVHHTPEAHIRQAVDNAKGICRNQITRDATDGLLAHAEAVARDATAKALGQ